MNPKKKTTVQRRGTAAVELAVCLPFLLIVIMGIWEVGRMVQAQQLIANAAREGGRQASAGQQTSANLQQYVVNYLNMNGLTNVDTTMVSLVNKTNASRSDPTAALQLDQFELTVTVPYSAIRYSTIAQITPTTALTASADWYSMRDSPIAVVTTIPPN
jgi:Flp pilus assembly protein TadG